MSNVTTVTVICGDFEPDEIRARLDNILAEQESEARFKRVDEYYGGNKNAQCYVFGCAINYLDVDHFVRGALSLPWENPEELMIVVQPEEGPVRMARPAPGTRPTLCSWSPGLRATFPITLLTQLEAELPPLSTYQIVTAQFLRAMWLEQLELLQADRFELVAVRVTMNGEPVGLEPPDDSESEIGLTRRWTLTRASHVPAGERIYLTVSNLRDEPSPLRGALLSRNA